MIILKSDRLKVEICEPGEARNQTFRFDRAGFMSSIVLDDKHEFCTVEPNNLMHPCTGGAGLCSEIKDGGIWEAAKPGEYVPKFGVGLLLKEDASPYKIWGKYSAQLYPVRWEADGSKVLFTTDPVPYGGVALRQTKQIEVNGNELTVVYTYENTGDKELTLSEYCHNFVTIDRLPIGEEYVLSMPSIALQDGKRATRPDGTTYGTVYGSGRGFSYTAYNPSTASIAVESEEIDQNMPFSWTLSHRNSPASVTEEDSFVPERVVFWSIDHVLCPEVFSSFRISTGETVSYSRKWIFKD